MADITVAGIGYAPPTKYKDLGDGTYAVYTALEPASIGGGGSGGGAITTSAKGTTLAGSPTSEATDANTQSLHTRITNASIAVTGTFFQATQPVSGTVSVSNLPATQPVSGTVSVSNLPATQPISAISLPLPTGAATEATLGNVYTRLGDGSVRLEAGGATGAASPARALQMGGTDGTLLRAFSVDTSGRQNVNVIGTVPVSGTFWQATQPVSGTFWQVTQPVSIATMPITPVAGDVASGATDSGNPVKVGGRYNVTLPTLADGQRGDIQLDSRGNIRVQLANAQSTIGVVNPPSDAVSNTNTVLATGGFGLLYNGSTWDRMRSASAMPDNQTTPGPLGAGLYGYNGASWDRLRVTSAPSTATGATRSLAVDINAYQLLTYDASARGIVSGALVAGTAKQIMSFEHAVTSTRTTRIRRIIVHAIQTTALSGSFEIQITKGTAASSGGTAVTANPRKLTDTAAETVVKTLPTITAATVADTIPCGGFATTTTLYSPPFVVYDWQEGSNTKPLELTAGALQSIVLNVIASAAFNLTLTVSVDFSEE